MLDKVAWINGTESLPVGFKLLGSERKGLMCMNHTNKAFIYTPYLKVGLTDVCSQRYCNKATTDCIAQKPRFFPRDYNFIHSFHLCYS